MKKQAVEKYTSFLIKLKNKENCNIFMSSYLPISE